MPRKSNPPPPQEEEIPPQGATLSQEDEITPQAATPHSVTSASVGTALVVGAGSITAFTFTQPTSTATDDRTQLILVDAAAAPTPISSPPKVLYAANLIALSGMNEPRPGIGLTPGLTAPTWPKTLMSANPIPFVNGCFVQSCPANVTFTVTA
jgi:hypothetical protein